MRPDFEFVIPVGHPALPGHFPGNPVVPGVLLIEALDDLLRQSGRRLTGLSNFKFLRVVRPDEVIRLRLVESEPGDERGTAEFIGQDTVPVARGAWRAGTL